MSTPETSPFRKKSFVAAAIAVAVIALAAVIVLVTSIFGGASPEPLPSAAPTTSEPSPSADAEEDPSVCGLEGSEDENTLSNAPDVDWELVGTVAAPTSAVAGPGTDEQGFRSCYARTAEGALLMVANFIAMGTDSTLQPRLVELVAPGPGRDALETEVGSSNSSSSSRAQVAGYRIGSYTADAATIDVVMNYSDGSFVSIPLKVVWAEGDWKAEVTANGDFPLSPAQVPNLGGYTPWSGE